MNKSEKLHKYRLYCADEYTVIVELENEKYAFTPCIENNAVVMKQIIKSETNFDENPIIVELNTNDYECYLEDAIDDEEESAEYLEDDEMKRLEEEFISHIIEEQQYTDDDNITYEALDSDANTDIITNSSNLYNSDQPVEKEQHIFRKKSLNDKLLKAGTSSTATKHQSYYQNKNKWTSFEMDENSFMRVGNKQLKIDTKTVISAKEFKRQLNDTSDLQRINDKCKNKYNKYDNWLPKLFSSPMLKYTEANLLHLYQRNCISTFNENDNDIKLIPLSYQEKEIIYKNNNKRKILNIKRNENLFNDIYINNNCNKNRKYDNYINIETDDDDKKFIYIKNKKYEIINYS